VKNDRTLLLLGIVSLLGLGILVAHIWPPLEQTVGLNFGEGLWRERRMDLMIQLALLFVGALGIRALLPHEDEAD